MHRSTLYGGFCSRPPHGSGIVGRMGGRANKGG